MRVFFFFLRQCNHQFTHKSSYNRKLDNNRQLVPSMNSNDAWSRENNGVGLHKWKTPKVTCIYRVWLFDKFSMVDEKTIFDELMTGSFKGSVTLFNTRCQIRGVVLREWQHC